MSRINKSLIHTVEKPTREIFIYGLIDPDSNEIKYIGLSTRGFNRIRDHWNSVHKNTKTAVKCWIKGLKQERKQIFDIVYLEYFNIDSELVDEAEQFWIGYFKSLGSKLLNHELGGRSTRGKFNFSETRKIHRERTKQALSNLEIRKKLSDLTKKQWADPEMRARMSKKVNINKNAQEKSKKTRQLRAGAKFVDDLGNNYNCLQDFVDKWNVTYNQVQHALYYGAKIVGRVLTRTTPKQVMPRKKGSK